MQIIKKILLALIAVPVVYLSYCFTRGALYGVKHGKATDPEIARKIATFRG